MNDKGLLSGSPFANYRTMFTVIAIMFGGIVLGYLFREKKVLAKIGKPIHYTILLLLFLLGLSVGNNREIIMNLPLLGGQALLLASAATLGSVVAAWGISRLFFHRDKKTEDEG